MYKASEILAIFDECCDAYTFPMLDNGYVYLAATRLSLFRSPADWAMVIEVFGFMPRAELPDTSLYTFASQVYNQRRRENFVNRQAFENYLANNPYNARNTVFPIDPGDWQNPDDIELVSQSAECLTLRDEVIQIPRPFEFSTYGITLLNEPRIKLFELCRYLAHVRREQVLATPEELRINVLPEMEQILQLDEWHRPDVADDSVRPSGNETFQQLAAVLEHNSPALYRPSMRSNTHWNN